MAKLFLVILAVIVAVVHKPASTKAAAVPSGVGGSTSAKEIEDISGFILFRRSSSGKMEYLLVEKASEPGDWSPPKGHVEENESTLEAAFREIREETQLLPQHFDPVLEIYEYFEYETKAGIEKHVNLWPAELTALDQPIIISDESRDYKWADSTETLKIVKKQYKQAFSSAIHKLNCHFDTKDC